MQVNQISPQTNVGELANEDLLMAHATLHSYYREFTQLEREIEGWDLEDVIVQHDEVREELDERGLEHQNLNELDDEDPEVEVAMSTEVEEWVDSVIESEDEAEFIQSNPPEADWLLEAIDFVEQKDGSINITDYVTLSAIPTDELDEWVQEWGGEVGVDGVVGYHYDEEEEAGVMLAKEDDEFLIAFDEEVVAQSDETDTIYSQYNEITESVEEAETVEQAVHDTLDVEEDSTEDTELFLNQGVMVDTSQDHDWYVWDQSEAEEWLEQRDFDVTEPTRQSGMALYPQTEGELFHTSFEWRGPIQRGEVLDPRLDGKPYLVEWGFQTEVPDLPEHPTISQVGFRVEPPADGVELNQKLLGLEEDSSEEESESSDEDEEPNEVEQEFSEVFDKELEIEQATIDDDAEKDWYWYNWGPEEITQWVTAQNLPSGDVEVNDGFLQYEIQNPEVYQELETTWMGRREQSTVDQMAGGEKPRRVTFGYKDGDEPKEIQKIEFNI